MCKQLQSIKPIVDTQRCCFCSKQHTSQNHRLRTLVYNHASTCTGSLSMSCLMQRMPDIIIVVDSKADRPTHGQTHNQTAKQGHTNKK